MAEINLIWLSIGLIVLFIGLSSNLIKSRLWISEPLLATLFGVCIGPAGFDWIDPLQWPDYGMIIEETARITLAIALMSVALRVPPYYFRQFKNAIALVLLTIMPLMFVASGVLVYVIFQVPLLIAFIIGAAVTPTDPVVASALITGPLAEAKIPAALRRFISVESGANDGLAYPFVMLPILLTQHPTATALGEWAVHSFLWKVGAASVFGIFTGYAAAKLLIWAEHHGTIEKVYFLGYTIALSLIALGGARLIGANDVFAVFVAGVTLSWFIEVDDRMEEGRIQEAVNHFFTLPVFVLFGMVLPWGRWVETGWAGIALCTAVLLLRRLPFVWLLYPLFAPLKNRHEAAFDGWFGPIGVAALYYIAFSHGKVGNEQIWSLGTEIIFASIVVHGITATPLTRRFR